MADPFQTPDPGPWSGPTKDVTPRRGNRSHLVLGIILVAVGGVLLAMNLGLEIPYRLWTYYPIVIIALGLIGIVTPSRHLGRSGGIWLLAAGLYCLVSEFRLFGLWWSNAWPIFLIATGCDIIFSHNDRWPERREDA